MSHWIELQNESAVGLAELPVLSVENFSRQAIMDVAEGMRICALFAAPADGRMRLYAVLADDPAGTLRAACCEVGESYPSLTPDCPQAGLFEREIAEQWGVEPVGHPLLRPVRFHESFRAGKAVFAAGPCGAMDFVAVGGSEEHEVAVGPVHAGIIEPGHFRFECHGEDVHHLEISLGYQHRGIERALLAGDHELPAEVRRARVIHYMETLAGDTTIGHASAYCQAVEALAQCYAPPRSMAIRGIALELERLANHIGDLGALAGDVGYLPTQSFCGRIRGDALNMTAVLCGNRFGRGLVRPGGCAWDIDAAMAGDLRGRLDALDKDVHTALELLWNTPSVTARFEGIGKLSRKTCREIGMVGVAARACDCEQDVRKDLPFGIYRYIQIPTSVLPDGDVFARAQVRHLEIQQSIAFIREQLEHLPSGPVMTACGQPAGGMLVVSLTEGWRGEICHVGITDAEGRWQRYKVVDPSFHNWLGLALALRAGQISDFPLCNKSFNLSYCGHDL